MIYDHNVRTLSALPRVQAQKYPDRVALTCNDRSMTFRDLEELVTKHAHYLSAQGVGPGDRVGLLAKESDTTIAMLLAIARCGGVSVPLNWKLTAPEIAFIIEDSSSSIVITTSDMVTKHVEGNLPARLILLDEIEDGTVGSSFPEVAPEDVAVQLYTSGTTGVPKGVELPHDSFFALARELSERNETWMGWEMDDVALSALPVFHVGGLWWLVRVLASAGHAVILPQFVGWQAIEAIEKHQITKLALVPAMIHVMLSEPEATPERFRSLRTVGYGGAPMPYPLLQRAMRVLKCDFLQAYGLTETGNIAVSLGPADHYVAERVGSAGRPLPGVEVQVVDQGKKPLAPGEVGEICIKTPAMMLRYHKRESATRETLVEGWLHSGDAGYVGDDGFIFVSGRIKDMICSAGEKIWPAEVESVLGEHPAIREIAVVGDPHPDWGETVRAVVSLKEDSQLSLAELRGFARDRLASFKQPTRLDIVAALPRTASGKVMKHELRVGQPSLT